MAIPNLSSRSLRGRTLTRHQPLLIRNQRDPPGMARAARERQGLKGTCISGSQKRKFRKGFKLMVERTKLPETQKTSTVTIVGRKGCQPKSAHL